MFIATKKLQWYEYVGRNNNLMLKFIFQSTVNSTRRGKYCENIIRAPTAQH